MFDDNHRVACVDEALEHADELVDVGHVQAHRRFVKHVERVRTLASPGGDGILDLGELAHELDALRLAAGKRG